jgi:hypothetical protein
MFGTSWDGVMPGGRIHRPRARLAGRATPAAGRVSASAARLRRVTPARRGALRLAGVALALATLVPGHASANPVDAGTGPVVQSHAAAASLDGRVELLSAELQLTPEQQSKVRALLQQQREQVRQVWSDASVPAALRIGRTQGIRDRTVEAIRGLLDESQRQRYIQPLPRAAAVGTAGADVRAWMDKGAGQ